jgi:hypothetical protein
MGKLLVLVSCLTPGVHFKAGLGRASPSARLASVVPFLSVTVGNFHSALDRYGDLGLSFRMAHHSDCELYLVATALSGPADG